MNRRALRVAVFAGLLSSASFGYYHFIHYANGNGPFTAIPEKFDLAALPNSTVSYHISDNGPTTYAATDGFSLVVGQIRAAAKVWNDIETSELRLRFGGVTAQGASQTSGTPSIDVVFEDLPPGVNGYGGPTVRNDVVTNASGALIPIQRSVVVLAKNIAARQSWTEAYFQTAVHEFGHALGLQHSFVSGAMATEITRATTKIRPILPDDVIGLSVLYPTKSFREGLGAISGRVASTANEAIGMASVVAVAPGGAAIGTLTHPDGTYRIEGLPPGQYFLYAHPLPPTLQGEATPGNVVLPVDNANRALAGGQQFDTVFYPSTRTPLATVTVTANGSADGMNITVTRRATAPSIHSVQTYSFPGQRAVKPAHVYTAGARNLVVMSGFGLIQGGQPLAGLQIGAISGAVTVAPGGIRPYTPAPDSYLQTDFQFGLLAGEGPVHLLFTRGTDVYVLPYGLRVVERVAPQIDSLIRNENGDVVVGGSALYASTQIAFDGAAATTRSFDEATGRLTVTPPAAPSGTTSHVVAMNVDGQSSQFLQAATSYNYPTTSAEVATVLSTTQLTAGTESVVEISGSNFIDGMTTFGFGSPDVDVRKVWIVSPTRALANVWVAPGAAGNSLPFTVLNGLRLTTQTGAVQVASGRPGWLTVPVAQNNTLVTGMSSTIQVNGLALGGPGQVQVTVNDRPAQVIGVDGSNVIFVVPSTTPLGPAVVRVQSGNDSALPIAVQVAPPPAMVSSVVVGLGVSVTNDRPARLGDVLNLLVTGLPEGLMPANGQPRVTVTIGGVDHRPTSVNGAGTALLMQVAVQPTVTAGNQTMQITVEGYNILPYTLPIR